MSMYQLIFTDRTGHIVLAEDHDCTEDQSALRYARSVLKGRRYLDQVEIWLRDIADGLTTTVLAISVRPEPVEGDGEIIGYASVASDGLAWTRHVRELRVLVSPSMRGKRSRRASGNSAIGK